MQIVAVMQILKLSTYNLTREVREASQAFQSRFSSAYRDLRLQIFVLRSKWRKYTAITGFEER